MRECPNCGYGCNMQIVNYFWQYVAKNIHFSQYQSDENNFIWQCPSCHKKYELEVEINVYFSLSKKEVES